MWYADSMTGNPTPTSQQITETELPADRVKKTRTLYDASAGEIFWKNFVAGMGRALGGIFLYLLLSFVVWVILYQFVWPKVAPFIDNFADMAESLQSFRGIQLPGNLTLPGR